MLIYHYLLEIKPEALCILASAVYTVGQCRHSSTMSKHVLIHLVKDER